MDKNIIVKIKHSYGNELIYIVSEHKEHIKELTGRKTLTKKDIFCLKQLGYSVSIKSHTVTL